uniref:ARAD1C10736p n=1 Tax=Blastobotrys adeninivorans TaxID=409370 RepID=A0A060T079_BLAAD
MKPIVGAGSAWFCTLLSVFAVLILSVLGLLFKSGAEALMGSVNAPEDGAAVASTIFGAVFVYLIFLVFCGCQVVLHRRQNKIRL